MMRKVISGKQTAGFRCCGITACILAALPVAAVRPKIVYLVQHTHSDIGFARPQSEIISHYVEHIDHALDYCEMTEDYPSDAQFHWTCETAGAVLNFLRTRPPEQESGNALYVNLFIPSRITWRGFTFELSETALKCVSAAANVSSPVLYVREPRKSYRKVVRTWKPGDEIDVGEKWTFRMEALPDDPSHAALFYGPWLLGGCLGTEGMRKNATRSLNYYEHDYTVPEHLRDISLGDLTKVVPIKEDFDKREYAKEKKLAYLHAPVVFQNENGVVLKPLAWINGERWVVYWRVGQ